MTKHASSRFPTTLVLDAGDRDSTTLTLLQNSSVTVSENYQKRAQEIPSLIETFLEQLGLDLGEILLIGVVVVGKSLTGIRLALTVANTISEQNKIGVLSLQSSNPTEIIREISSHQNASNFRRLISP